MLMTQFAQRLVAFNSMYGLPISFSPVTSWSHADKNARPEDVNAWRNQVTNFFIILNKEIEEIDDILEALDETVAIDEGPDFAVLTMVADWLGDVVVYCMSEATKYGVADDVPNLFYCDHFGYGNYVDDDESVELALLAIKESVLELVTYNEAVLLGQPSAKNMSKFLVTLIARCFHEAERFGFNLYPVLSIIMDSNMSKLGADGKPIINEFGKVEKGPNYWKPEPKIEEYLTSLFCEEEDSDDGELELEDDEDLDADDDDTEAIEK